MKVFVFSFFVFFVSPLLFSETLTVAQVNAIVKSDPVRANTEKTIALATEQVAKILAPSRTKFYVNFMRAYAWVINDMNTGSDTVYKLGSAWLSDLNSSGIPLDTNSVTTYLSKLIIANNEEAGEEGLPILILLFNLADERIESIADENAPLFINWQAQAKDILKKILNLASQL